MKVYLAGKIGKNDWRHSIFTGLDRAEVAHDKGSIRAQLMRDGMTYNGPYFLACDHGCYHGENTHGRMQAVDFCTSRGDSHQQVIRKCFEWIEGADKVFVWLDSSDAYGTITEIGYAKALGKPIFLALDAKLKGSAFERDCWFALHSADEGVYCESAEQAWAIFVGEKKKTEVELATEAQINFILRLCKEKGKAPRQVLDAITKDTAGKMIAYLQSDKFTEEMDEWFDEMSEEEKEQIKKEEPRYKATEVVNRIKEHFAAYADFTFSTQKHAKYVKLHHAKDNPRFAKTVPVERFYSETTFYSQVWIDFLIQQLEKERLTPTN